MPPPVLGGPHMIQYEQEHRLVCLGASSDFSHNPMASLQPAFITLLSYLIGCFSTAYYLVRWQTGLDIRQVESGNAGERHSASRFALRGPGY